MTNNNGNESARYDLTYLEELSAGDPLFIRDIITQFVAEAPIVIKKIQIAAFQENWTELAYLIHKFGPNLAFVGLNDISEEVNMLEQYSKNHTDLAAIPGLIEVLVNRSELAINSLKKDFEL
jgi:HPt (histidine-containing phosphotransfer) domain-containing protein